MRNEDLSFYYAQIATYAYDGSNRSAFLRDVQLQTVDRLSDVGMAVTMDEILTKRIN